MDAKPTLLVVDDEVNVALTLRLIFEREGFDVITATSCADALTALSRPGKFDVVITDLNMERQDIGLDVARAALQLKPRPVVIICTGYADVDNARAALDLRVDFYATKPVDIDELKTAIARFRRGRLHRVRARTG